MATKAGRIPSPEYVEFNAGTIQRPDLMGLRLPVQTISNRLLNGYVASNYASKGDRYDPEYLTFRAGEYPVRHTSHC